jgi:pimeloyl-ACP methyl ester carboxylesterase
MMNNLRKYGSAPFAAAVIHGGPGAPGYMAPVARELAAITGVLEPLQTTASLEGQLQELKILLEENAALPVTLIGHSYGAMLGFIFSARFPSLVKKLVLIGSGGFEEKYAEKIMTTRLNRLDEGERGEVHSLLERISDPAVSDKNAALARFGYLCKKADCYDPINLHEEALECQYYIHVSVWQDVSDLRASGELLKLANRINIPVRAIHGDYDPHPAEGVQDPLSAALKNFKFFLLKNCGHYPWLEKKRRGNFFGILKNELS